MRWRYKLLILLSPILLMVAVNELSRSFVAGQPYEIYGVAAINSVAQSREKCSWQCHNDIQYCKRYHVGHLEGFARYTDPVYFLLIDSLRVTGNYRLANLIFLVLLVPLVIWFLLVKVLAHYFRTSKTKREHG